MTRKKNAEPCPRCTLIRQEWRRGSYHVYTVSRSGQGEMCWHCYRIVQRENLIALDAERARIRFAENEMWSLESGALT